MTDLHTRLVAAIDQAERDAREDYRRGRGGHWAMFALHGLAEDRDILRRHAPVSTRCEACHPPHDDGPYCSCGEPFDECPELLSLARRHGIDPEAATT